MRGRTSAGPAGGRPDTWRETTRFIVLLGTLEASDPGEQNCCKGQRQSQEQLRDQQITELTIVGRGFGGARCGVPDLAGDDIHIVEIFRAKLAQGKRKVRKRRHHRKERGFEACRR